MSENVRDWAVSVTYVIYVLAFYSINILGAGYAVFVLGHSGWWMLAAIIVCGMAYRPETWANLNRNGEPYIPEYLRK